MFNTLLKTALGLALIAASGLASATVLPFGPQNDVAVSTVTNDWGWSECYSASYATPFGSSAYSVLADCSGELVMLAARRTGSSVFEVLAAAERDAVLSYTGPENNGITTSANGAEWYNEDDYSIGFAGLGDSVDKSQCDVAGRGERDRLCWHTMDYVGGWRAGSFTGLNGDATWEKVILVADATAVPVPATALLLSLGLLGFTLRRRYN